MLLLLGEVFIFNKKTGVVNKMKIAIFSRLKKKAEADIFFYVVVGILMIGIVGGIVASSRANEPQNFLCSDAVYPYHLNTTLCMNTSSYVDSSNTSYADAENVGITGTEQTMMSLIVIILVIALVWVVVGQTGKRK